MQIWYHNVPHTKLAEVKGHQNWVKFSGEYLTFPGGGTQFKHGALHYIDFIQQVNIDPFKLYFIPCNFLIFFHPQCFLLYDVKGIEVVMMINYGRN